ncbi:MULTISPECIES: hypothetical protein [unclassified Colwellia]|uniref:hypothetical protein n=1 Tax=unclassified Colwellia TaxID=196834 RepID=UPI0015F78124|nr:MULTISPECIES: hypothetical protein [unclassified Colwellia]MBA6230715.1 hypothetical protein [Colwellia sp. MB02u-7]MBA6234646.1 hypothetical protein [Colwellia sp. MB02u-11]MBA6255510.1 hypothetical protein [Colwellia sp. MB3u-28]MBA6261650.1 hypothetical protein [Colwellia sp. MB3u-41]MBA6301200.1 hypothetical protein [Colwellia sp. MB3u-22]
MSFLKRLFNKKEDERQVNSAEELKIKDIIVLTDSFALPESLRTQQFQVSAINCYEFESKTETEWVLQGENNLELYLTIEKDDQTYLKFALKIQHEDIESLFDLDEFATIFDDPGQAFLERKSDSSLTSGWSSSQYQQRVFAKVGYFHRKDNRTESLSAYEGNEAGEQFELYSLLDEEQSRGIDIEVWQDGETDLFITLYRPTSDIIDIFPGS